MSDQVIQNSPGAGRPRIASAATQIPPPVIPRDSSAVPQPQVKKEMTSRDLSDQLEDLAKRSEGRSKEAIQKDFDAILDRARSSRSITQCIEKIGENEFRERLYSLAGCCCPVSQAKKWHGRLHLLKQQRRLMR